MLPFKPTGAQKRVLAEIAQDMAQPHPMNRLLQGDVGSGKTMVAAEAAIIAIENGYQVAVLAPTEILAAQHYFYFKNLFAKLGYVVVLLTGSSTAREKAQLKKLLAAGLVHVAIGTHALLEKDVEFHKLGLAIVDEQHRFGVMQRLKLMRRACIPDVLVMTATPIPRTLALTMYGDLDTSVIDELPPGRKPIMTKHVTEDRVEQVYSFLQEADRRGAAGVRRVSGDRGIGDAGDEGGAEDARASVEDRVPGYCRSACCMASCRRTRKKRSMARFKRGRDADPGFDDGDRSRRGRAECDGDGDRAGGALRAGAVASVARARGPRRGAELLHSGDRQAERDGA